MLRELLSKGEFSRFIVVGAINTVSAYILYFVLNIFMHYQLAYGIAYASGIVLSYWLNTGWVFKSQRSWKKFFAFPFVYVVQYGLSVLLLHFMVEVAYISEWLSPIVVTIAGIPVTFVLSRLIIKNNPPDMQQPKS